MYRDYILNYKITNLKNCNVKEIGIKIDELKEKQLEGVAIFIGCKSPLIFAVSKPLSDI